MKHTKVIEILLALFAVVLCFGPVGLAEPVGTAFNYLGHLTDADQPANGLYDFQFKLFDAESGGNQIGSTIDKGNFNVIDGYLKDMKLDFGADSFNGDARWLEIGIRPGDQEDPAEYTLLTGRQELRPTPYAIRALSGGGGGGIGGSGTANRIAKFTSGNAIGDSVVYESSGNIGIDKPIPAAKLDVSGDISAASNYKIAGSTVLSVAGTGNTLVGVGAGAVNTGTSNTFSGYQAGYSNTTGSNNTFSGLYAGYSNTTGSDNTFSGLYAGCSNTTGSNNTFSGLYAGHENTTGNYNTFSGNHAGYSDTTGGNNTFSGYQAGYLNTTGSYNTFLGNQAGRSNTTGPSNTFSGYEAGYSNTTGSNNTFSGYYAGYSNTTGSGNTFSGYRAGRSNTTGGGNTFSGCEAGYSNITGISNTFSGNYAGYSNNTGSDNTFSGIEAGYSNTTGNNNTFSGYFAGFSNTTGSGNVFLGYLAGYQANATVSNKLYIANYYTDANTLIYGDFSAKYVGINTTAPARNLHINDVMRLQPRATAPSSPGEGDIYYDSVSHNLMVYNGTIWKPCF